MLYSCPPIVSLIYYLATYTCHFPILNDSGTDVVDYGKLERGVGSKGEGYHCFYLMLTEHLHECSIVCSLCVRLLNDLPCFISA
jgi:hypothetical protein